MRRIQLLPILMVAAACASEPQGPATLVVTTTSLRDAAPNVVYADTLVATGGDGSYTWSVTVGSPPLGLSLDTPTGEISGTPRGSGSTFTVQVVSGDGQTAAQQLTITTNALLAVTSSSLPNGVQTVAYSDTLSATGGVGNYTWSVTVGSLPTGLTLNTSTGEISGTPTGLLTSNLTVVVASEDGQTAAQALTITVNALFQSVTGGNLHTCGLTTAGAATCWGANAFGQLGDGSNTYSNVPVVVLGGLTLQSVTAGESYSCGLTTVGVAYCWGRNLRGQLGDGTNTDSDVPVAVSGGLTFQSVAAEQWHSCGVTTTGAAYCWGYNIAGQLGNGTNRDSSNVPVAVLGGLTFQSVTAGDFHSCGVTTAGAAYCWGHNIDGPLGDGTLIDRSVPVAVLRGFTFMSVTAGDRYSCGVTTAGAAYCWGVNLLGQLGTGSNWPLQTVPVAVSGGLTFQSVSAGSWHSCGVTTVGAAYCWGRNLAGEVGDGTVIERGMPVAVLGGHTFRSVTAGDFHSCGVTIAGAAYCWGNNFAGQLGNSTNTESYVPVLVSGP